jgi:hypothetical protein
VVRAGALGALAVVAIIHLNTTEHWLSQKTVAVGRGADRILAGHRGRAVNEMLSAMERDCPAGGTLAVVPEGVMLNYLSRRENPTRYITFLAPVMIIFGEEQMTEAVRRHPPDVIIWAIRPEDEYGQGPFGLGYGRDLWTWMRANYDSVHVCEPRRKGEFPMVLLRRGAGTADAGE